MKNRFVILSLLAATLFACTSDSMSNDDLDLMNQEVKLKAAVERPFKIKKIEGTYSFFPGDGESCAALALNAIGEGTITHLGRSTMLEEWCSENPGDLGIRSITITAANGDELRGYHSSIEFIGANPTVFVETLNFDGGSGRFENATGVFIETVIVFEDSPSSGTFIMSGEGTITY
ncbi:hypothetical protein SAMN06265375_10144 [Muriicola jejuensis]|uniref:Lipocalin-like domain-containing protein n=1 Tax=Muriicola jejuensis TaxID=504488 RepID=A0A6P0UAT7_9FLAO|nr:hypothetical protein [Muriicola jejuensis]NER10411.1 hypothetical protein [Muriicola jejuensis]SMP00916.1 hypothetical protein SAMN06265375_10144 [Muriicola jejuensis]